MPRSAPSPAQPRASPRRRGGQRLETYPGSCWESLALPEVPGLPFASIAEPPRPPTPDTPSPTAKRSAAAAGSEPQLSVPPPPPPPPARRLRSSASAEPGQRREPVTRGLGSAQPRRLAHPPSPPPRPIPTSPPPPPHPHLLLLPLLPAHVGRSSRTSCNQCGDVTHPVRSPACPRAHTLGPPRQRDPSWAAREPRDSSGGVGHAKQAGRREAHPESAQITWAGCGGGGGAGSSARAVRWAGRRQRPRGPLVRTIHSSSWGPAPDSEVAPAALPASVPPFPATARKFRSRTPGAHPHPALPGQSSRTPGSGGLADGGDPHARTPATSFIFPSRGKFSGSRSTLARPARLPALPRQRYGAVPAKVISEL